MANALHWNHPPQLDEDRNSSVNFMWWALVSQDIWYDPKEIEESIG